MEKIFTVSPSPHGREAGEITNRILKGENPSQIGVSYGSTRNFFDYVKLKEAGLSVQSVPNDAIIINSPYAFIERHATTIIILFVIFIMTDLISGRETLDEVNMIVFVGGFSNSDVLGSAKGWAGAFLYNPKAKQALDGFFNRPDTLSLGVCNGCQLMVELGLIYPEHGW